MLLSCYCESHWPEIRRSDDARATIRPYDATKVRRSDVDGMCWARTQAWEGRRWNGVVSSERGRPAGKVQGIYRRFDRRARSSCRGLACSDARNVRSARHCAAVEHAGDVPILMLAARDDRADLLDGLAEGATDYIMKPFPVAQVRARIQSWV